MFHLVYVLEEGKKKYLKEFLKNKYQNHFEWTDTELFSLRFKSIQDTLRIVVNLLNEYDKIYIANFDFDNNLEKSYLELSKEDFSENFSEYFDLMGEF